MRLFFLVVLLTTGAFAQNKLEQVYGSPNVACTVDSDLDTATSNRLGPFVAGKLYRVACLDATAAAPNGSFVACECISGSSTVDASAVNGPVLNSGETFFTTFRGGALYLSCVPFANDKYLQVCPWN